MKEIPILFSGPMVRAILEGRKTQTRRVINPQPIDWTTPCGAGMSALWPAMRTKRGIVDPRPCPYGQPGSRLWVRETWASFGVSYSITPPPVPRECQIRYHADNKCEWRAIPDVAKGVYPIASFRLHPSIHMPRWASRITLEITGIRVERLQVISLEDAKAEGVDTVEQYAELWASINGAESWDADPWVWVVEFKQAAQAGKGEG